jgi:hypothetical protein
MTVQTWIRALVWLHGPIVAFARDTFHHDRQTHGSHRSLTGTLRHQHGPSLAGLSFRGESWDLVLVSTQSIPSRPLLIFQSFRIFDRISIQLPLAPPPHRTITPGQEAALAAALAISRTTPSTSSHPPANSGMPTPIYPSETPIHMPAKRAAGKFWVVIVGYRVGVYDNIDDALKVTEGFDGFKLVGPGTYQWCVGEFHRVYDSEVRVIPWPTWCD